MANLALLNGIPFLWCHAPGRADPKRLPSMQHLSELSSCCARTSCSMLSDGIAENPVDAASKSRVLGISETGPHSAPTYGSFEDRFLDSGLV